jgi:hypothetical protein
MCRMRFGLVPSRDGTCCAARRRPGVSGVGRSIAGVGLAAGLLLLVAVPASATAPYGRGMLLRGTVVTMDGHFRVVREGSVLVRGRRIVAVWAGRRAPRGVRVGRAVLVAPRGALIFPGLF